MQPKVLNTLLCSFSLIGLLVVNPLFAQEQAAKTAANSATSSMTMEERMAHLERLVNSQGLVDILLRLESLQKDVQQIQGDSEVQLHKLEELKKRQRDLYIDIDRRLLQLERRQAATPAKDDKKQAEHDAAPVMATAKHHEKAAGMSMGKEKDIVAGGKPTGGGNRAVAVETPKLEAKPVLTEQAAYQKAFDLLRELRYDKASEAFREFILNYPEGRYAHIAQYWLAEASYAQRHFQVAIENYQKLIDSYPSSPKRAEAMLKISYSYYELKKFPEAQAILEQLIASYPGTTEAGQAQNLLQKIKLNNAS